MLKKILYLILALILMLNLCACGSKQATNQNDTEATVDATDYSESFGWQGQKLDAPNLKSFEYEEDLAVTHFSDIETICKAIIETASKDERFHNVEIKDIENVVFPDAGQIAYSTAKTILIDGQNEAFDISLYTQATDYATVDSICFTMQSNALTKENQDIAAMLLSIIDKELGEYVVRATDPDMKESNKKDDLNDPTQLSEIIKVENGYYTIDRFVANDCVMIDIYATADNLLNNLGIDGRVLILDEISALIDAALGSNFGTEPTDDIVGGRYPIYNEGFGDVFANTLLGENAYTNINEFTVTKTEKDDNAFYTCELMYDVMKEQDAILSVTQHIQFTVKKDEDISIDSVADSDIGFIIEMKQYHEFTDMTHEEKVNLVVTAASLLQHSTGFDGIELSETSSVMQMEIPYQFFVKEGNAGIEIVKSNSSGLKLSFNPHLFNQQ